jgi:deoxyribodipyrimidine photo-lyase
VSVAVCWFGRNLRLDDNATLAAALRHADAVVPLFLFDQTDLTEGASPPRLAVLAESVLELSEVLRAKGSRLVVRGGSPGEALFTICRETGADAVFAPRDHETPAKQGEAAARKALERGGVRLHLVEDLHLVSAGSLSTETGRPFTVFTPFWRRWLERDKERPVAEPGTVPTPDAVRAEAFRSLPPEELRAARGGGAPEKPRGGAREAHRLWSTFRGTALPRYAERRDRPDLPGTSRLSPHLHAGTIGVRRLLSEAREAWRETDAAGKRSVEAFTKELAWREFYAAVLEGFPRLATENHRPEFDRFPWASGEEETRRFAVWSEGRTGFPIVDAGMRQLLREGWMHNRVRMIVASFLTKDLLVDWRRGEAFFQRHLADADLASNSGSWQWAAGSGTDAQPFFRIFNPVLQGLKFDPQGDYVRKWIPELSRCRTARPGEIHAPWKLPAPPPDYPAPVVDHASARTAALTAFAAIRA